MKILYFSQFFAPENIAASFRATDHSCLWAKAGHDVVVFTSWPNYPTGILANGYKMEQLGEEKVDGVRVFRSASKIQPNTSFKKRIESGVSFIVGGLKNLKNESPVGTDYDVVLVTCGTVFSAWLGVHYAKKHKLPLVVEFRDLTYKQMIAAGGSEDSAKVQAMKKMELSFCKAADMTVVLTEGFKKDLTKEGISESDIYVVPNGADIVPCEHDWKNRLRFGYFGTMGLSQDVPTTLNYAAELYKEELIGSYYLIGEGAARSAVENAIAVSDSEYLTLRHGIPMAELERYYSAVDMTVVSLQKSNSFAGTIPSKIFQSFARGVPVLFIGPEGEAASLVRDSGAGLALTGQRDEDIQVLLDFARQKDLQQVLETMSKNAIEFMEQKYTRKCLADKMLDILTAASKAKK